MDKLENQLHTKHIELVQDNEKRMKKLQEDTLNRPHRERDRYQFTYKCFNKKQFKMQGQLDSCEGVPKSMLYPRTYRKAKTRKVAFTPENLNSSSIEKRIQMPYIKDLARISSKSTKMKKKLWRSSFCSEFTCGQLYN